jgi:hypothetical protein
VAVNATISKVHDEVCAGIEDGDCLEGVGVEGIVKARIADDVAALFHAYGVALAQSNEPIRSG